ncbi:MBL fold metallo-hydrolase [Dinghuibacter silviterrae]|uniref:Phosphoribosyl 1,2-cyclic phosphodiesterase n=1 Tax=Dinghuibacter silviterrae TaxID=1539049 RepID=A0A4R8DFF8_9BACT|nr:MBL fold metallo-hydrolase [Dinghuibacter silviterrae]TDW95816.1 phosphoribosyl 1,2-cyclic phosphodiesterase [Dinghuibacter silviterrae]
MSLSIASLNSGSNGNCYYVGNDQDALLVDAGLSCREIERRMERLGLAMERVKGIFISHEHEDHIRGLQVLSRRYKLPVYIAEATRRHVSVDTRLVQGLPETVVVGSLSVTSFSKAHDAADPCSFVIASGDLRVGVFTDIGVVCDNLIRHFMQCHAAFLETNYDEQLLEEGRYPYPLKKRIRGGQGHLSNRQSLELFMGYRPAYLSHLLLSHLSEDNNRPELVRALFEEKAGGTVITVASRYEETGVIVVDGSYTGEAGPFWNAEGVVTRPEEPAPVPAPAMRRRKTLKTINTAQISLFNNDPHADR